MDNEDREYIALGTLTLTDVTFYIRAASEEEAKEKAARGEWDDYDTSAASSEDWKIWPDTCHENR